MPELMHFSPDAEPEAILGAFGRDGAAIIDDVLSSTEVDEILGDLLDVGPLRIDQDESAALRALVETRRAELVEARAADSGETASPLARVAAAFELEDSDVDLLVLALAPLVNARYLLFLSTAMDGSLQVIGGDQGAVRITSDGARVGESLDKARSSVEVCRARD